MNACVHCGKSTTASGAILCGECRRAWEDTTLVVGSYRLKYAPGWTGKNPRSILIEHEGEQMTVESEGPTGLEAALAKFWSERF